MISLNYAITKDDYINFFTYVTWDAPGNSKKRMIYYAKQFIPIILFLLAFYYTGLFARSSKFILLIAGFLALTSFMSLLGMRSSTLRQAEKITNDPGNNSIFLDMNLIVSENGLIIKNELKESRYQWKAIIKKLESNQYYFLFHSSLQAIIIPKRIFISAEEKMQFERLLTQHLSLDAEVSHLLKN